MALVGAPEPRTDRKLERWIESLPEDDQATIIGYLRDENYQPTALTRFFSQNGFDGSDRLIYTWRKKNL